MVSSYMGRILEVYSHMGAFPNQFSCVDLTIRYLDLDTVSPEANGLEPLTYGHSLFLSQHHYGSSYCFCHYTTMGRLTLMKPQPTHPGKNI